MIAVTFADLFKIQSAVAGSSESQSVKEDNPSSSVRLTQQTPSQYNSPAQRYILYHALWHVPATSSREPRTVTQLSPLLGVIILITHNLKS